jgi:hypothetical protein
LVLWRVHCPLNFVRKLVQMLGQPFKHFALGVVRSQVPNKGAFGSVFPQLLEMRLIVFHRDDLPPVPKGSSVGQPLANLGLRRAVREGLLGGSGPEVGSSSCGIIEHSFEVCIGSPPAMRNAAYRC